MRAINIIFLGTLILLIGGFTKSQAQNIEDALRFSEYNSSGSARVMGIGGTQNAIGGDVSNIHGNPAGLGFFRRSEFSFTASYGNWRSTSTFLNQSQTDNTGNFALPNLSLVISKAKDPLTRDNWRGHTFGISINRSHSLHNNYGYYSTDVRSNSSLLDYYLNDYNEFGEPAIGDPAGLPLDVGLIEIPSAGNYRITDYAIGGPFQDETIENEGSRSQVTFSYGTNYQNKLFIGGALGITSYNFRSTKTFNEEFFDSDDIQALYYSLQENLYQNGTGINLNVGLIYKPVDQVNLGFSFRSPTWSRFEQEFDADIIAEFFDTNGNLESDEFQASDIYLSTINLRSPMKISVGGAYFINKNGFITADIDYLDYSSMNLSSPDFSMEPENQDIRSFAQGVVNYRLGGEYRLNILRLRAGGAYLGDPLDDPDFDRSRIRFTGGVGIKLPKMYIDLAILHDQFNSYYFSYPGAPVAAVDNRQTTGMLTMGFNF